MRAPDNSPPAFRWSGHDLEVHLMNNLGVEGKLVADQLGHSLDVNQNVYTKSPVDRRKLVVDQLEQALVTQ